MLLCVNKKGFIVVLEPAAIVTIAIFFFLYGIVIGSFVNVVIMRTPIHESITLKRSHCMTCGHTIRWYDLIPLFSYVFLKGKCRDCGSHISIQYPIVEGANGIIYAGIYLYREFVLYEGISVNTFLYCFAASALLALSVIDWRTQEIPFGINVFIFILGLIRLFTDLKHWPEYVIGFFAVSGFLALLIVFCNLVLHKEAMGWGDVKLMAATGLLLGWKLNILAFFIGCVLGSVIHLTRMAVKKGTDHVLAFGPYLSMGLFIVMIWGEQLVSWYLRMWSFKSL